MEFIRFAGTINTHEEKKVAKATVNVILEDCTGTFYITDIMFQEGKWLSGYVVNNLEKNVPSTKIITPQIQIRGISSRKSLDTAPEIEAFDRKR